GCTVVGGVPVAPALAFPVLFRPFMLSGNPLFTQPGNDRNSAFSQRQSESIRFTADTTLRINDGLTLDAGFTYSGYRRGIEGTDTFGDLLQNALAGFGGPNCAFASPESRAGLTQAQLAAVAGTGGCTYFNPFSTGMAGNTVTGAVNANFAGTRAPAGFNLTPGAGLINDLPTIDNFFRTTRSDTDTQLIVADLVLSGRSGIRLPGGEISFAVGGQYRADRYEIRYNADADLNVNPCPGSALTANAICAQQTGALGFLGTNRGRIITGNVYAVFGELQAPVTDTLNVQFSARFEDYGGRTGSTFNPQGRVRWQATSWLALRAGAGTTFRGPPAQNLDGQITSLQVIGTSFRAIDILGNNDLRPETTTTYSGGAIVKLGGFNASVDYWRYELAGPIEAEPVQGIVNTLFGANGVANCNNPTFAGLQSRFTFTAAGCGIANVQRLRTQLVNSANVTTQGFDFQAQYRFALGKADLVFGGTGTYTLDYQVQDFSAAGVVVQRSFNAVGLLNFQTTAYPLPQLKGNIYLQGDLDIHQVRFQVNYIDGYRDQRTAAVFGPNTGALAGASVTNGQNIGSFTTVDFTYRLALKSKTTLSLSVLNMLNQLPPFARLDFNYDPFTASPLGVNAKVGLTQRF
ncbi:MAG: TonB-dependent receptor, partial [Sphingomonas sp.]|nr:TonB-dependent receptor [Sphingomonas sp.]